MSVRAAREREAAAAVDRRPDPEQSGENGSLLANVALPDRDTSHLTDVQPSIPMESIPHRDQSRVGLAEVAEEVESGNESDYSN